MLILHRVLLPSLPLLRLEARVIVKNNNKNPLGYRGG